MAKFRCALAGLIGFGVVEVCACTIKTGPPPDSQTAPAAPAPTAAAAPTPAPVPNPTPAATTAGPNLATPAPGAATAAPAPSVTAAPSSDAGAYDSCAGKKCGDRCNLCPAQKPGCFETALVKMCHPDGQCKPATTVDCAKK